MSEPTLDIIFTPELMKRFGVRFSKGTLILKENEPGSSMYIIHKGQVKLYTRGLDGSQIPIDILGPGNIFGEMAVIDSGYRAASAEALTDTELLELSRENFLLLTHEKPEFAERLLHIFNDRIRRSDSRLRELSYRLLKYEVLNRILLEFVTYARASADSDMMRSKLASFSMSREKLEEMLEYKDYDSISMVLRDLVVEGYLTLCSKEISLRHT